MNPHDTGILRGLIQALLAVTKTSTPKTTATTASEAVMNLTVQVAGEILTKIESMESVSAVTPTVAHPAPAQPAA